MQGQARQTRAWRALPPLALALLLLSACGASGTAPTLAGAAMVLRDPTQGQTVGIAQGQILALALWRLPASARRALQRQHVAAPWLHSDRFPPATQLRVLSGRPTVVHLAGGPSLQSVGGHRAAVIFLRGGQAGISPVRVLWTGCRSCRGAPTLLALRVRVWLN